MSSKVWVIGLVWWIDSIGTGGRCPAQYQQIGNHSFLQTKLRFCEVAVHLMNSSVRLTVGRLDRFVIFVFLNTSYQMLVTFFIHVDKPQDFSITALLSPLFENRGAMLWKVSNKKTFSDESMVRLSVQFFRPDVLLRIQESSRFDIWKKALGLLKLELRFDQCSLDVWCWHRFFVQVTSLRMWPSVSCSLRVRSIRIGVPKTCSKKPNVPSNLCFRLWRRGTFQCWWRTQKRSYYLRWLYRIACLLFESYFENEAVEWRVMKKPDLTHFSWCSFIANRGLCLRMMLRRWDSHGVITHLTANLS